MSRACSSPRSSGWPRCAPKAPPSAPRSAVRPHSTLPCPPARTGSCGTSPGTWRRSTSGSTPSSPAAAPTAPTPRPTRRCPPTSTPWRLVRRLHRAARAPSTPSTLTCPPGTGHRRRRRPPSGTGAWPTRPRSTAGTPRWPAASRTHRAQTRRDGVTEVLDSWLPAGRRSGPADRAGMIHLTPPTWTTAGMSACAVPGSPCWTPTPSSTPTTPTTRHRRGPASDLVLALSAGSPSTRCW